MGTMRTKLFFHFRLALGCGRGKRKEERGKRKEGSGATHHLPSSSKIQVYLHLLTYDFIRTNQPFAWFYLSLLDTLFTVFLEEIHCIGFDIFYGNVSISGKYRPNVEK